MEKEKGYLKSALLPSSGRVLWEFTGNLLQVSARERRCLFGKGYLKRRFAVSGSLLTALKTEGLGAAVAAVGWVDKPNISRDVVLSLGLDPTYAY